MDFYERGQIRKLVESASQHLIKAAIYTGMNNPKETGYHLTKAVEQSLYAAERYTKELERKE